jgi:hypothetical protein
MFTATGSDCSHFVVYEHKSKRRLSGLATDRPREIHQHIDFNTFETRTTAIPAGYRKKSYNKEWMLDYYCDTSRPRLLPSKLVLPKGTKMYFTHNNGGRAFMVLVKGNVVEVSKRSKDNYTLDRDFSQVDAQNAWMFNEKIATFKCEQVFVGKSYLNSMTNFSGGYGKRFDGNSFFLCTKKLHYIHIGNEIISFRTDEDILEYYSPVGNSDCPYAYAISENNVYILSGKNAYLPISAFPKFTKKVRLDASSYFYGEYFKKYEKLAKPLKKLTVLVPRED